MTTPNPLRSALLSAALVLCLPPLFSADAPPATAPVAQAEAQPLSLSDAMKVFRTAPAAPSDASGLGAAAASLRDWDTAQGYLSNLENYFENNDFNNAINQARQYARQTRSPEIRQLWQTLVDAMKVEQKKRETELSASLDTELKKAATALLAATKSTQVDAIADSLQTLQESLGNNYSIRTQRGRNRLSNAISFVSQWQDLLYMVETGDNEGARNQLRNFTSNSSRDRLLTRSEIIARGASLNISQADVAAETAKIDELVKRATAIALSATKPAQLGPVIEELYVLRDSRNSSYDNRLQRIYTRVDTVVNFFQQWQDVLGAIESGDITDARNLLRNLAANSYRYRPLSRSDILARAAALKVEEAASDDVLKGITLDNLADYRARLSVAQESANGRRSSEYYNTVNELDRLITATTALKAGLVGDGRTALRGLSTSGSGPLQDTLAQLKSQWFARALPALTGLKDLPPYEDGETTLAYARRQLDAAIAAGDWARAHRFALAEKDMMPDSSSCGTRANTTGTNPAASIGAWLDGQLMEKAAQSAAAAELYRTALKNGAPPKLEEQLIARLRALPETAK
jgi:hypothetical protein